MDHIVFYKEGESLKDHFTNQKLSYTRKHNFYFASIYDQIGKLLPKIGEDFLLFYFAEKLENIDKVRIKNLRIKYPNIDICIFSNIQEAIMAWKLQVFHFDQLIELATIDIAIAYKKHIRKKGGAEREYLIKTKNGLVRIPFDSINCLIAGGNYTTLSLKGDKSITETKQLGKYMELCEKDPNFYRMGRSLIINLRNVKNVGKLQVVFYNSSSTLKVSKNLERKIKKILLT